MNINPKQFRKGAAGERGALLIIVLWIALGLVTITLYFGNTVNLEMKASENRLRSLQSEQAIEGATRYVSFILGTYGTNGLLPDHALFKKEEVLLGDTRFWFIG